MVKIGDAVSMSDPANENITTDDRQSVVQTLGGNVVQDFGYFANGFKVSWELQFDRENWDKVTNYWTNRTMVDVSDEQGNSFTGRVVIKSFGFVDYFRDHIIATIEFWMV